MCLSSIYHFTEKMAEQIWIFIFWQIVNSSSFLFNRKKGPDNTTVCDYVLPDYMHIKRGHIKKPDSEYNTSQQVITEVMPMTT